LAGRANHQGENAPGGLCYSGAADAGGDARVNGGHGGAQENGSVGNGSNDFYKLIFGTLLPAPSIKVP